MSYHRPNRMLWSALALLLALLTGMTGCGSGRDAEPTALPQVEQDLLALPTAFRYEVTLRPAGASDEPATVITGQYREGAWAQSSRRGEEAAEELIVSRESADAAWQSFTRSAAESVWTRWPGVGFDAGYGLSAPFAPLRLYPLADQTAPGEADPASGAPVPTTKVQAVFLPQTVQRLLRSGVSAVAATTDERSALEEQLASLVVTQTLTYWVSADNRIYQAAGMLLLAGADGQPTPWLEAGWKFSAYDDPALAITPPADYRDAAALAPAESPAQAAEVELDPRTTLRVRVFANPGVPPERATVTIYPAGKRQPLGAAEATDAQFVLAPGSYDVLVQVDQAEEWLKGVTVTADDVASQDVVFDFGALVLTVTQNGATPQVDIVVYPAGQRQTWVVWRTENPTTVRLRPGKYDIEVALPDYTGSKTLDGVEIRPGQTVTQTLEIGQ